MKKLTFAIAVTSLSSFVLAEESAVEDAISEPTSLEQKADSKKAESNNATITVTEETDGNTKTTKMDIDIEDIWHNGDHTTDFYYGNLSSTYQWLDNARSTDIGISIRLGETVFLQADSNGVTDLNGEEISSGSRWAAGARFPITDIATAHAIWDYHRFDSSPNHAGLEGGVVVAYKRTFVAGTARANLTLPETTLIATGEAGLRFDDWLAISGFIAESPDAQTSYGIKGRLSLGLD